MSGDVVIDDTKEKLKIGAAEILFQLRELVAADGEALTREFIARAERAIRRLLRPLAYHTARYLSLPPGPDKDEELLDIKAIQTASLFLFGAAQRQIQTYALRTLPKDVARIVIKVLAEGFLPPPLARLVGVLMEGVL